MEKLKTGLIVAAACLAAGVVGWFVPQVLFSLGWLGPAAATSDGTALLPGSGSLSESSGTAAVESNLFPLEANGKPMVVNLNDPKLTRYLSVAITLEAQPQYVKRVKETLDKKKPIVRCYLTKYFADKTVDQVRGRAAISHMLREICDELNRLLFPDEGGRIRDVYFEEFSVQ